MENSTHGRIGSLHVSEASELRGETLLSFARSGHWNGSFPRLGP
jgi:hypothetical protein